MPNWCYNRVHISGEAEDMRRLRDVSCRMVPQEPDGGEATEPLYVLDFNKMIPVEGPTASSQHEKWGTKWNLTTEDMDKWFDEDDSVELQFDTAWGPPHRIYRWMEDFITLHGLDISISWFYDEPGMQFAGYLNTEM
jgi:hypothetical protein